MSEKDNKESGGTNKDIMTAVALGVSSAFVISGTGLLWLCNHTEYDVPTTLTALGMIACGAWGIERKIGIVRTIGQKIKDIQKQK